MQVLDKPVIAHNELLRLKPSHKQIARLRAMGFRGKEIANYLNLSVNHVSNVLKTPLFLAEVDRIVDEIEENELSEESRDGTFIKLRASSRGAAERLAIEVDNEDEGASASTRISAANSILDRAGYRAKETSDTPSVIFLEFSPEKLSALRAKHGITPQPDYIDAEAIIND